MMILKLFNFKLFFLFFSLPSIFRLITCISLLLYVVSCGAGGTFSPSPSPPSSSSSLDSIRSLTLRGVDENSITINWELLKTEEGAVDYMIVYTVYAETHNGEGAFTKDPDTETVYTLTLINLEEAILLPIDDTGNRAEGVQISGLKNNTPYRIVVEARDTSGNTSRSRLLAYTAFLLTNTDITGVEVSTTTDSKDVTVIWDPQEGAQAYLIQVGEGQNQFGGVVLTDKVLTVTCPPGSLLCEKKSQFAEQLEDDRLKYILKVNKNEGRYRLVVIPLNFRDLAGLRSVDDEGQVKTIIEEVLIQAEDENSVLSSRLEDALEDPDQVKEVQIKMNEAGVPTDLVLEPTGSTLSAKWGHGEGAESYYAILTSEGVNPVTNTIDRYEESGRFTGGGYTGFGNLTANTLYTVTVQSLTVSDNNTNIGGEVSTTLSTKNADDTLDAPEKVARENLSLIGEEIEKLRILWNNPEANSVIGYNVFYWAGDTAPNQPQYVARKGENDLIFTVQPNTYKVRVDVLSTYPGQEWVPGDTSSITIYGKPLAPKDLGVMFSQGKFTSIADKLYAIGYPLNYSEADTPTEGGGPVGDVSYHYRYRVEGGEWIGYNEITDEAMISLQVDDLNDVAVVKAGYGKKYQVEVIASNAGGFVSDVETLGFTYKSFPEPFMQRGNLKVETGDRSLTVTWPEVSEVNGAMVVNYTAILNEDPYELPVKTITTMERKVVFENLVNNQPYLITVIPNGMVTGNIFTALYLTTDYKIGDAIKQGSQEEIVLSNYIGVPEFYTPQGAPEAVINLAVIADDLPNADDDQVTVTWEDTSMGSPATGYVLEYLSGVATPINNLYTNGDAADAELSGLNWEGAVSTNVVINDSGSYSQVVDDLNISSTTNVFRVKGIRIDDSGKEWASAYRYYALGNDRSRAPGPVEELSFSNPDENSFTLTWAEPSDPGRDRNKVPAQLIGYRVSWGTTEELGNSFDSSDFDTPSYTITGLNPGTQYHVKVEAKNDNLEGNIYSTGTTGSTYTIKTPGEVVDSTIIYSEHTTNSFKVSWAGVTDAGYGPEGKFSSVGYLLELSSEGTWQSIARSDYLTTTETLSDLTPGTGYRVRVTATNGYSSAAPMEGRDTWALSLPGQVGGLVVSDPSYDKTLHQGGFKVSWTAPADTGITADGSNATVTGYEVAYAVVSNDVVGEYTSVTHEGTATTHVLANLNPHAEYDIRIQAQTAAGVGIGSHISGWVPSLPSAVDSDSILFSSSTASTIQIAWTAPEPGKAGGSSESNTFTSYQVEISPDGSETYTLVQDNYSDTILTAANLSKSTSYRVRITAKNNWGEAGASVSTSMGITTENDPIPPSPVENLKVDSFTANQVVFSWTAPTDPGTDGNIAATLSGYVVKYKETAANEFIEIDEKSEGVRLSGALTATTTTVIGLSANTSYTFLVVAINSANYVGPDGQAPSIEQVTTPIPPRGLAKALTCDKATSVDLVWDISSGATSYKLYRNNQEILENIFTNSYTDTGLTSATTYTYKVRACSAAGCSSDSDSLMITTLSDRSLKDIVDSGRIPAEFTGYDDSSRKIFSRYYVDTPLVARYLKPGGSGDGSSFDQAAGNLKTVINGITDATADKVYALFLTGGNYQAGAEITMKNHVAIIGGMDECLGSSDTVTALDGEGRYRVFMNYTNSLDNTALLYGVSVINGKAGSGGGMYNHQSSPSLVKVTFSRNISSFLGGGIYNSSSSPSLTEVAFSRNSANNGGGMYNSYSSPSLAGITFSNNTANFGGGMYNATSPSSLVGVTFSGNTASSSGGGMYNSLSSPNLVGITFSGNTANYYGGGMYNSLSSPNLVGITFSGNTANYYGGGMYNDNDGGVGSLVINSIFWGNTASLGGSQFYFNNNSTAQENLRIYNSIVVGGTGTLVSGTVYTSIDQEGFGSESGETAPIVISFANIITNDPELGALADNGGSVLTHAIENTSSAVNQGLYVRKSGTTLYYSDDNTDWYTSPALSGTAVTLPAGAEDLTDTDATGYKRTNRPDLGAYEYR